MKKILYIIAVLTAAAAASSCESAFCDAGTAGSETEGVATVRFKLPAAVTRSIDPNAYPWKDDCDIRIYKKTESLGKELIRHYFGPDEMPGQIWLLEGDYIVSVSLGSGEPATFDKPSYYGETDFRIEAGKSTDVAVQCNLLNTIVEVVFDESVTAVFDKDLRVTAMIGESYDSNSASDGVNALTYTATKRGYFMLPAEASAISFCFNGHSSDPSVKDKDGNSDPEVGEIHEHFTKKIEEGKTAGYLYRLKFTYSPDAQGHLTWDFNITCDTSEDTSESFFPVNPAPKPLITGSGWDINSTAQVAGELRYDVSSQTSELRKVKIECGGKTFEIDLETVRFAATDYSGIEVESEAGNLNEITLVLKKGFFDNFTGGEHVVRLTATARNDAEASARSTVMMPGAFSLTPTDKWNAQGEFRAYLFRDGASDVKIRYRAALSGNWSEAQAEPEGDNVWKAAGNAINANTEYEYQLVVGGEATGAANTTATDDGPQIYNSDFETWSKQGNVLCPYLDLYTDQWWDSGNHGSAPFIGNITLNSNDARPDSPGSTSALLSSGKTLGVLAAGNIYLGKFVTTKNMTKGVVRFGHSFDFTYRPKALQFWYKGTVGTVDVFSSGTPEIQNGGQDKQQIYILLCDMPGPHIVDTSNQDSFLNVTNGMDEISYYSGDISAISANNCSNDATGKVIAWGVWENDATIDDWMLKTIELNYTQYADIKPQWLMITACANKYGDYYSGCSKNVIYLDDMELVY